MVRSGRSLALGVGESSLLMCFCCYCCNELFVRKLMLAGDAMCSCSGSNCLSRSLCLMVSHCWTIKCFCLYDASCLLRNFKSYCHLLLCDCRAQFACSLSLFGSQSSSVFSVHAQLTVGRICDCSFIVKYCLLYVQPFNSCNCSSNKAFLTSINSILDCFSKSFSFLLGQYFFVLINIVTFYHLN